MTGFATRYDSHCIVYVPLLKYESITMATCSVKMNPQWSLADVDDSVSLKYDRMKASLDKYGIPYDQVAVNQRGEIASFGEADDFKYVACEDRNPIFFAECQMNEKKEWTVLNYVFDENIIELPELPEMTFTQQSEHIANKVEVQLKVDPLKTIELKCLCERPADPSGFKLFKSEHDCTEVCNDELTKCFLEGNEEFRPTSCNKDALIDRSDDLELVSTLSVLAKSNLRTTGEKSEIKVNSFSYGPIESGINAVHFDSRIGMFLLHHFSEATEFLNLLEMATDKDFNDVLIVVVDSFDLDPIFGESEIEKFENVAEDATLINCNGLLPSSNHIR